MFGAADVIQRTALTDPELALEACDQWIEQIDTNIKALSGRTHERDREALGSFKATRERAERLRLTIEDGIKS